MDTSQTDMTLIGTGPLLGADPPSGKAPTDNESIDPAPDTVPTGRMTMRRPTTEKHSGRQYSAGRVPDERLRAKSGRAHVKADFTVQRMHEFRRLFLDMRRESGMEQAVGYWFESFIDEWLAWIGAEPCQAGDSRCCSTTEGRVGGAEGYRDQGDWLAYLAVGMTEMLSIRDVLILTLLTGVAKTEAAPAREGVSVDRLKDMASTPHRHENAALMTGELERVFRIAPCACALRRCRNGISALSAMCAAVPEEYRVQALAVIAYVNWWLGDQSAESYARQALSLDSSCRLAAIVICALEHNIHPNDAGKQSFRE